MTIRILPAAWIEFFITGTAGLQKRDSKPEQTRERERERERENNTKCQWIVSKWREITTRKKEEVWMLPQ